MPGASGSVLAVVDYPDRPDAATVVVVTATDQKLTPWLRAVADQVTSEGFIAVVPDALAGATADVAAVRNYVVRHPAANGRSADITLSSMIDVNTATADARFELSKNAWPAAMAFLSKASGNDHSTVVSCRRTCISPRRTARRRDADQGRDGERDRAPEGRLRVVADARLSRRKARDAAGGPLHREIDAAALPDSIGVGGRPDTGYLHGQDSHARHLPARDRQSGHRRRDAAWTGHGRMGAVGRRSVVT